MICGQLLRILRKSNLYCMNKKDKKILLKLSKSMHKAFYKAFNYSDKQTKQGKDVVGDVVDPNYTAEADPSKIPARRTGVMYKGKYTKKDIAKKTAEHLVKKYEEHKKGNL